MTEKKEKKTVDAKDKLDELDKLRLQLHDERRARLQAQAQATAQAHMQLRRELVAADDEWAKTSNEVKKKYGLSDDDNIDIAAGTITRKKAD